MSLEKNPIKAFLFLKEKCNKIPKHAPIKMYLGKKAISNRTYLVPEGKRMRGTIALTMQDNNWFAGIPDNTEFIGNLYISSFKQGFDIPKNLIVRGDLEVINAGWAVKYSNHELREAIESKGGFVYGNVTCTVTRLRKKYWIFKKAEQFK